MALICLDYLFSALCFINQYADAWYYNHVTYQIEARIHKRQYQAATTLRRQQQQGMLPSILFRNLAIDVLFLSPWIK